MLNLGLSDREVRFRLEVVARQAVRSAAVDAVVLFGSRARGDFRPDSDWDVALLARSDCEHPDVVATGKRIEAVDRYSEFQVWSQTTAYVQTYADRSNLVAGAVATQGVPLAGKWPLTPEGQERRQFMDLEGMRAQQSQVCQYIVDGWSAVGDECDAIAPDTRGASNRSSLAAELLAKNIISSHSVQPTRTHDLNGLAEQLEDLPLKAWESEEERRHDVETLRKMNGIAAKLHVEIYGPRLEGIETLEECIQRLLLTMELQISWLFRCASRGEEWNQAARFAGEYIVKKTLKIRHMGTDTGQDLLDVLPSHAVRRITEWEASARRLVKSPSLPTGAS